MASRHTCNNGEGPYFGRRTPGCPRCDELARGAAPVRWDSNGPGRLHICDNRCPSQRCPARKY